MAENSGEGAEGAAAGTGGKVGRVLVTHVLAPLAVLYGLRWWGVDQFVALLAGAGLPLAGAAHEIATRRRVSGVRLFVLGTMVLTVAMSFLAGSPRVLLMRNCWGMVAIGLWIVASLFARRPFLYEAARVVLDQEKQRTWQSNWDRYPPFRRLLWVCSAFWGVACLADAAVRVAMAATLPIDLVPLLDDILLVLTLAAILIFQRLYGRSFMRRHGLRIHGVRISHLTPSREPA